MKVTVADHQITDIEIVKAPNGRSDAKKDLKGCVTEKQSPEIDSISGAAADGKAYLQAVENALLNACPAP